MWDVVGDICEDVFGCINAIKHLVLRQHITDGLPLRQDRGHLQQLLCMLCCETYRLTTQKRLIRCYSVECVDPLLLLFIVGYLLQLLIGHEFIWRRFQFLFNGSEHFLQVDARYPGEDVLHSWICELWLWIVWDSWIKLHKLIYCTNHKYLLQLVSWRNFIKFPCKSKKSKQTKHKTISPFDKSCTEAFIIIAPKILADLQNVTYNLIVCNF